MINESELECDNFASCDVLEDENGEYGVYFTLIEGNAESYFTKAELVKMIEEIESEDALFEEGD